MGKCIQGAQNGVNHFHAVVIKRACARAWDGPLESGEFQRSFNGLSNLRRSTAVIPSVARWTGFDMQTLPTLSARRLPVSNGQALLLTYPNKLTKTSANGLNYVRCPKSAWKYAPAAARRPKNTEFLWFRRRRVRPSAASSAPSLPQRRRPEPQLAPHRATIQSSHSSPLHCGLWVFVVLMSPQ